MQKQFIAIPNNPIRAHLPPGRFPQKSVPIRSTRSIRVPFKKSAPRRGPRSPKNPSPSVPPVQSVFPFNKIRANPPISALSRRVRVPFHPIHPENQFIFPNQTQNLYVRADSIRPYIPDLLTLSKKMKFIYIKKFSTCLPPGRLIKTHHLNYHGNVPNQTQNLYVRADSIRPYIKVLLTLSKKMKFIYIKKFSACLPPGRFPQKSVPIRSTRSIRVPFKKNPRQSAKSPPRPAGSAFPPKSVPIRSTRSIRVPLHTP